MQIERPKVYAWAEDMFREHSIIDTDSIAQVVSWCAAFSGNHRLSNDVALPLERMVVGSYQIGYIWDYLKCKNEAKKREYMEEGIASILIHIIASYEMTGRLTLTQIYYDTWSAIVSNQSLDQYAETTLLNLSEQTFKYQRWMLYNHMKRTKRWNEIEFRENYYGILTQCLRLARHFDCDLANGFALAMSKIQDGEIKRH